MNDKVKALLSILESAGFSHDDLAGTVAELNDAVNDGKSTSIQLVSPAQLRVTLNGLMTKLFLLRAFVIAMNQIY